MHYAAEKLDTKVKLEFLKLLLLNKELRALHAMFLSFVLMREKQTSFCINFPKTGWGGLGKEPVIFPPLYVEILHKFTQMTPR